MDPVQQKMMRYMPLMFMVFLYNFSAGLTLYWTVQNLLTIAQMKLTKRRDPTAGSREDPGHTGPSGAKRRNIEARDQGQTNHHLCQLNPKPSWKSCSSSWL